MKTKKNVKYTSFLLIVVLFLALGISYAQEGELYSRYNLNNLNGESFSELKNDDNNLSAQIIYQEGHFNEAIVYSRGQIIMETYQVGDQNKFEFYGNNQMQNKTYNLQSYQKGNNNYLSIRGVNSISDGMVIRQTGNGINMYINNYK